MKIDPQLRTGVGAPTTPRPSKHRWIDIGGGRVQDANTKRVMKLSSLRSPPVDRMIVLTEEQWAKLEALAAHRTRIERNNPNIKKPITPQECVVSFINACVVESTWEHPLTSAAKHQAKT